MAKRFIDTELFQDSWFMNLSVELKLFFIYLITNCDNAGIIDLNIRLAEFQTGVKDLSNSLQTVCKLFGDKRMIHLTDNYYFMPNFIRYQYPNGLSSTVKAQYSVILKLSEFNINIQTVSKQLGKSYLTPQDKDMDKDKDKDKDIRGCGGNFEQEVFEDTDLNFKIMDYFHFTEIKNPDKLSMLFPFLNLLKTDNRIEEFIKQFESYKAYKEISKETIFSFNRFLGTIENRYVDGGWNAENWSAKLDGWKQKTGLVTQGESVIDYNRKLVEKMRQGG